MIQSLLKSSVRGLELYLVDSVWNLLKNNIKSFVKNKYPFPHYCSSALLMQTANSPLETKWLLPVLIWYNISNSVSFSKKFLWIEKKKYIEFQLKKICFVLEKYFGCFAIFLRLRNYLFYFKSILVFNLKKFLRSDFFNSKQTFSWV